LVRELARSLLLSGDLDRAASEVDPVVDRGTDNPFLLDLAAEVAIRRRDFARAERLIVQLEVLEPRFGLYRKSRLRLRQGQYKDAEEAAKQAVGESRTPLFEVLAQLALSQMWNGKLDDAASTLEKLRQRYPSLRQKAQLGLQCRLQIRRGNFRLALELSDRIGKHGSRTDRSLRLAALKGELETAALPDAKRVEYENEVTELEASVADIDENELATEHLGHIFP
jgi:Flp pilus assembly protein TadD